MGRGRKWITLLICLALGLPLWTTNVAPAQAVVIDPISQDWTAQVYGGFLQIGNGVLRCDPNAPPASADSCSRMHSGLPTTQNNTNTNDTNRMVYADTDANPATYNSTSATITIPAGATVAYARLYWAATNGSYLTDNKGLVAAPGCSAEGSFSLPPAGADPMGTVRLTAGGVTTAVTGALQNQTANGQIQPKGGNDSHALYYSADADVTGLLASLPSGSAQQISVANLWTPQGIGCFGGWALQVVYDYGSFIPGNLDSTLKQVYQFGGHVRQFQGDSKVEVRLDGINPQGSGAKAGLVVFEGDASVGSEDVGYIDSSGDKQPFTNIRGDQSDFWVSHALGSVPYAPYSGPYFFNGSADVATGNLPLLTEADSWMALELSAGQDSYLFSAAMIQVPIAEVTIDKRAISGDDYQVLLPGQQPNYSISVYASGAVPLQNIRVTDALAANCVRTITGLTTGAGQTYTCTGPATTTPLTNTADVVAATASGYQVLDTDTTAVQIASLDLAKTSNQVDVAYGTPAQWTITVTNTGSAELRQVAVTDPLSPNCARTIPSIPAGGNVSYVCSSPNLTQGMTNTARASAIAGSPNQPPLTVQETNLANNSASVLVTGIGLTKTSSDLAAEPGDQVTFTFTIRNTMETVLDPVEVVDPQFPTCSRTGLGPIAPRASTSYDCAVTITEPITNTAQAFGSSPSGVTVNSSSSVRVETKQIELVKSATTTDTNGNSILDAGDQVAYSFLVTNSGSSTLTGITLTDPMLTGLSCPQTTLGAHTEMTCTAAPYTVTPADVQAGILTNTATVRAEGPGGTTSPADDVVATDSETLRPVQVPRVEFTKTAAPMSVTAVGQPVTYTFTGRNTGNVTVTGVQVSDPLAGLSGLSCTPAQPATLAPGDSIVCTATRNTTQTDLTAGSVTNTATLVFVEPQGSTITQTSAVTVTGIQLPELSLTKQAAPLTFSLPSQQITYTLVATNTGNVPLRGVAINDPSTTLSCPSGSPADLAPGEFLQCTGTITTTQAMVDAGSLTNTAETYGTGPRGQLATDTAQEIVAVTANPTLDVTKTPSRPTVTDVGDVVVYTIVAANTGNQTLSGVTVTDELDGLGALSCTPATPATLAPGASVRCTASYTVTEADLDRGTIDNTASGSARSPGSLTNNITDTGSAQVRVLEVFNLQATKSVTPQTVTAAGQTTSYTIQVTNLSNVAFSGLQVDDPLLPTLVCSPVPIGGRLAAGASTTCTGSREVSQTDVDLGRVDNTVHVSGTSPQLATTQTSASAQVIIPADPSIVIDKTTTTPTVDAADQTLAYTLLVTNDGNVTLTDVWPSDPSLPGLVCTPVAGSSLAPGATMTCTCSRLATQADINSGAIPNTATVHAERPGGLVDVPADDVTDSDAEIITPARMPAIDIEKTTTATGYTWAGEQIPYSFLVRNSGNVTLSQVRITDPIPGLSAISCDRVAPVTLNPGDEMTCTATKTVQQSEVDAGSFTNAATASGIGPGNQTVTDTSGVPLSVIAANALSLTKTATPVTITSGTQPVSYSLLAVNTGNQTLSNVTITDDLLTTLSCTPAAPATLAPGARMTCTGSYSATLADLDAGSILNTARVDGSAPTGPAVSAGDDFTVTVDQRPRLALTKTPSPATVIRLGESVSYTFVATNTGNVTVSGVQIADAKPPPVPPVPPTPPPDAPMPPDKPPRLPQTGGTPGNRTAIVAEWQPPAYLRRDEEE